MIEVYLVSGSAHLGFIRPARSIVRAVEIDLVVSLSGERESETRAAKTASQTPAPGDVAMLQPKARTDANMLLPAKRDRFGRPEPA
jgi:hypothetical protein